MSGSASSAPNKIVFAPIGPPDAETVVLTAPAAKMGALIPMLFGVVVIVGALAYLLIEREPEIEVLEFSSAFSCPVGAVESAAQMRVTASMLNVRAGPSQRADRLLDRTLRKKMTVTEECREGSWSRVRLGDGRSGWVANEFLSRVSG
jgi:hypothetical protein